MVGTYYKTPVSIKGVVSFHCDVLKKDDVQMALYTFRPDFTIYSVGLHSINESDDNVELADALNSAGLFNVTEYCQRYKSQICYISSCYVSQENIRYLITRIKMKYFSIWQNYF